MKRRGMRSGLTGLRTGLGLIFLALAIPTAVLVLQAYSQLKWEAFHQTRGQAEELAGRIERDFARLVAAEEARAYGDYAFLVVSGDPSSNFLRPSAISGIPSKLGVPGLLGYFQVDDDGRFSSPLLPRDGVSPAAWGVDGEDLRQRRRLAAQLRDILARNRLVGTSPTGAAATADSDPADSIAVDRARLDSGHITLERSGPPAEDPRAQRQIAAPSAAAGVDELAELAAGRAEASGFAEAPAARPGGTSGQALFDRLLSGSDRARSADQANSLGRVEDLQLEQRFALPEAAPATAEEALPAGRKAESKRRTTRKELASLPESRAPQRAAPGPASPPVESPAAADAPAPAGLRIRTFESEIDPLQLRRLDSGQLVLFRKVWREGRREIQGLLLDARAWLTGTVEPLYRETALARSADLVLAFGGEVLAVFSNQPERSYLASADELRGELLSQSRLGAPLSDLELIFSVNRLPAAPGTAVVTWLAVILAGVLVGGFVLLERLGAAQVRLAGQQQDFVSAVSHELKTPLTSIRMYAEMLREGWASEEKKRGYYDFIHDESERLSRLIHNVLQLARLTRNDLRVELKPVDPGTLMDGVRARIEPLAAAAGFELSIDCDPALGRARLELDEDCFAQIMINLVDNALKFSAAAERKRIELGCALRGNGRRVEFSVRDFGPGLPRQQMKKVFSLFYRVENELTRDTVGTGIGLALVRQLTLAMNGRVDVVNADPGAEFRIDFPVSAA